MLNILVKNCCCFEVSSSLFELNTNLKTKNWSRLFVLINHFPFGDQRNLERENDIDKQN